MESLTFYDISAGAVVTDQNLGQVAPSSSDDIMLRLANLSDLYQAKDVTVTVEGPDEVQLWLSLDGDTFTDTVQLGDIQPGASSATFWLRRVTPADATGPCTADLSAAPTAWVSAADTSPSDNVPLETE